MGVIIVGNGPAGVSAALYTVRASLKTTIIGAGLGALGTTSAVENYYGFPTPISGSDLVHNGISQARRLGAEIIEAEVVGLKTNEKGFIVETSEAEYHGNAVILATGASRAKPKWTGFDSFEHKGVSYCAVCDAFFFKGKDVAVVGSGAYALQEARVLLPIANSVTVCTDGAPITVEFPLEVRVIEHSVEALTCEEGKVRLGAIQFKNGTSIDVSGLFVALGIAGSTALAQKIGATIGGNNKDEIVVNERMHTSIPGLFAAGDCTGGMKQIVKAVYEGALAGTEAVIQAQE